MMRQKGRYQIWTQLQHPFKHTLNDFGYINEALPGVTNVEDALNYFSAVLYPNYIGTVDTPANLPLAGNTIGDYYTVRDDGDGNFAGYRWEQREGDVAASWYKVYDVDWSVDGILASLMDITQDLYVYQKGKTDLDNLGNPITGLFAGQRVWGGNLTGQNLTLDANSVDDTGFVQVNSNFRPTVDMMWDLGTATERFDNGHFATELFVGNMTLSNGSITDSSGAIDFDDENLSTTGFVSGNSLISGSYLEMAEIVTPANASAGTNRLYFKADNKLYKLDDAGNESLVGLTFTSSNDNRLIKSDGTGGDAIQESGIVISDLNEMTGVESITVNNLLIDGNTVSATGDLNLSATGQVVFGVARSTVLTNDAIFVPRTDGTLTSTSLNISAANALSGATSISVDNLLLDANTISSTIGDINIVPFSGVFTVNGSIFADADNTRDIGSGALRFNDIFLGGNIEDGTDAFIVSELMDLRSANYRDFARTQAAQAGDSLFYDAVNGVWLASAPDSEISHPTLSNLTIGDSGHTQFVMLAGRSGGQVIQGGVSASENLVLESTSNATKGAVLLRDHLRPETDASFSGGWQGTDLGQNAFNFRNLYMKGEAFGLRLENTTSGTLPASNANNVGRLVFATDNNKIYVDTGSSFIVAGVGKFSQDIVFNGIELIKNVDVSSNIVDARTAIIQLCDNANDFERIQAKIQATSTSNVRITTNVPLPAGSYRLIVVE